MTFQYQKISKYENRIKTNPVNKRGVGSFIGLITEDLYLHFYEEDSVEYVCVVKLPSYLVKTTEENITPCFGSLTGTICEGKKVTMETTEYFMSSLMGTLHEDIFLLLAEVESENVGVYHLPLFGGSNRTFKSSLVYFSMAGDYYPVPHNPYANIVAAHNKLNANRNTWTDIHAKYYMKS